jgi:UDP-N-acetylglucosamine--N-acetylmuramyl-(pentapeptide) pyrophosphoryl-undecaprenol N-acetylglucosamine transferase
MPFLKAKRIMLCGGGTGGHVFPLVEIARNIRKLDHEAKIYFVGPEEFPLTSLRKEKVIVKKIIGAGKIRRYFSLLYIWELVKFPFAFLHAFFTVFFINPDAVLGKGSYGSVLPVMCAKILRKKILLHESDAIPGLANKFLSKFTKNIAVAFSATGKYFPKKNIFLVGNPVRLKYLGLKKQEAEDILGFHSEKHIIFISGGSQGAQKINSVILESLDKLLENYYIIWSVGSKNYQNIIEIAGVKSHLKISALLSEKELAAAYTLCDLAIGRAGSGTIFETAAFGKPSILIPLERKGGDQPFNATAYANTGASTILNEPELAPERLISAINTILSSKSVIENMEENAQKFGRIRAGEEIAQILLSL